MALTAVTIVESGSQDDSQGFGSDVSSLCDAGCLSHRYPVDQHPVLWVTMFSDSKVLCICCQEFPCLEGRGSECRSAGETGVGVEPVASSCTMCTAPCHFTQQLRKVSVMASGASAFLGHVVMISRWGCGGGATGRQAAWPQLIHNSEVMTSQIFSSCQEYRLITGWNETFCQG